MPLSMHDGAGTRQIWALVVSGNYLLTLRATPTIGRIFTDADDRTSTDVPAMVSARFWSTELGGGESVAGRTLTSTDGSSRSSASFPMDSKARVGCTSPMSGFRSTACRR